MNISDGDFNKLVLATTEAVLLRIPEVIGNLMQNHAEINKLNKEFYASYPEFRSDPVSVRSVIGMLERDHPELRHQEILDLAAPKIKERMIDVSALDVSNVKPRSELSLSNGEI